jgi:hypothetical protein
VQRGATPGVVDGEEHAVGAEDGEGALKRREGRVPADGDVDVLAHDVRDEPAPSAPDSTASARARENGRFSPMCPTTTWRPG